MAEVRMRDFSTAPRELAFKAEEDVFQCYTELAPESLQEALGLIPIMQSDFKRTADFFELMMAPEPAARMRARLTPGPNAIGLPRALAIATWLIEEHSARPTMPSVDSFDGSQTGADGSSSTDGVQPAA